MPKQISPLTTYFSRVEDQRQAKGLRHPLVAILNLSCVALMAGIKSPRAMANYWRNRQDQAGFLKRLGFTKSYGPSRSTLYEVLSQVQVQQLEQAITLWLEDNFETLSEEGTAELEGLAIDGKQLKGSRKQGASVNQLLSVLSHRLSMTVAQVGIPQETNELGVMPELLAELVVEGRVLTMDALHTQVQTAQTIVQNGGQYVMLVKKNQPLLYETLEILFEQPGADPFINDQTTTFDAAHGRLEHRTLATSLTLTGFLDWPGLQQVFRLDRHTTIQKTGRVRQQTVYGITSLSPQRADAADLLKLVRQHWHIENRSHYVRDVTFGEDASQVRKANLPQTMAALRNCAINLIRLHGFRFIPDAFDFFAVHSFSALEAIGC